MTIEKLIQVQLLDQIEITAEDIQAFYDEHVGKTKDAETSEMIKDETVMIETLRMEKSQIQYQEWLMGLKNKIPVEINRDGVTHFLLEPKTQKENEND